MTIWLFIKIHKNKSKKKKHIPIKFQIRKIKSIFHKLAYTYIYKKIINDITYQSINKNI